MGISLRTFLSNSGVVDNARRKQRQWAQRAAILFRERTSAEAWPLILGVVAKESGVYQTPPPKPDLQFPELYLEDFAETLDFEIFSHKGRRRIPATSWANDKVNASQWIYDRVVTGVNNPEWSYRHSADDAVIIFAQLFQRS